MRCFDGVKNTLLVSYLNHDIRYSCSRKYNNKSQYHIYHNNNYLFSHYNKNSANSNFNIIDNHIVNHEIYSPNLHKTIYDIDLRIWSSSSSSWTQPSPSSSTSSPPLLSNENNYRYQYLNMHYNCYWKHYNNFYYHSHSENNFFYRQSNNNRANNYDYIIGNNNFSKYIFRQVNYIILDISFKEWEGKIFHFYNHHLIFNRLLYWNWATMRQGSMGMEWRSDWTKCTLPELCSDVWRGR